MRVKSMSSNWVTRATVFQLSAMRRAMTLRSCETGFLTIGPHCEKSICTGAGLAGAASIATAAGREAALIKRWI